MPGEGCLGGGHCRVMRRHRWRGDLGEVRCSCDDQPTASLAVIEDQTLPKVLPTDTVRMQPAGLYTCVIGDRRGQHSGPQIRETKSRE